FTHTDVSNPPEKAKTTFLLDITNATDIRIDLYYLVNVESGIQEMKTIKTYLINITICIMDIISKM
ncbi:MAG TPA: hypothetical protein VFB48_03295, partial [Nitrososphaeraceae archaeon]|nr:hypothetical protein [Nitrososphaeraceae archaeon]